MEFHWHQYNEEKWGKVFLGTFHGGLNQRFEYNGEELFVKGDSESNNVNNLVLDVYRSQDKKGAKVGIFYRYGTDNQKW